MLKFLLLFMIFISSMLLILNHPLNMGFYILILTLMTCMISGMISNSYWFSYILFLTFLGGLLVLFIYMSSIASNEIFFLSFKNMNWIIFNLMILLLLFLIFNNHFYMNLNNSFFSMENLYLFFNNENKIKISKIYNNHNFLLMLILIIYLFIALIAVIKITDIFQGPLRSNLF